MTKVWKWIEYNRFTVIVPVAACIMWLIAVGCTATVPSPISPGVLVDAAQLHLEFEVWQNDQEVMLLRFEAAGQDLEAQKEQQAAFIEFITQLAAGAVTGWSGLIPLLVGGGLLGALSDNIRKRGLIAGLKRNAGS